MNIYIFQYVAQVSDKHHPEGGVCIVAKTIEEAKVMIDLKDHVHITSDDWEEVIIYPLVGEHLPAIYIFPDAGCC